MTTAAIVNSTNSNKTNDSDKNVTAITSANNTDSNSSTDAVTDNASATPTSAINDTQQHLKQAAFMARGLADDAGKAIGKLLPTASLQNLTTRKYTLPDKTVASQVLMYRQLLHTNCRPGLKLSRAYQGTAAQKAVLHMPWWEQGIEESGKMAISYDNLITRLWINGAIMPFNQPKTTDLLLDVGSEDPNGNVETLLGEDGLPPIPHPYWVDRLGFQQPDPVTDFRSGGVLSLAMMVHMVESCPNICQRFFTGDTSVLPFGITCINVTDMMAKFLMLAKAVDKMDALLSQKPFWRMFADPNAILALQELSMSMLCDVVAELEKERSIPGLCKETGRHGEDNTKVTVFDFSYILEKTERRVRDDLLGSGPKTVVELRSIAGRLRLKYQNQLQRKVQRFELQQQQRGGGGGGGGESTPTSLPSPQINVGEVMAQAGNMAGGLFAKIKTAPGFPLRAKATESSQTPAPAKNPEPSPTVASMPAENSNPSSSSTTAASSNTQNQDSSMEGDWIGTEMAAATDAISNFSIGDESDEDL